MSKRTTALALAALHAHGVRCGELLEASPALIKTLAADGQVDPHKDAVAAALAAGAKTVRSWVELDDEFASAARNQLLVDISLLEEALEKAAEGEAREALLQELDAKKADLAAAQ